MQNYNEEDNKYYVKKIKGTVEGVVEVPGSKSITNRSLLMAALGLGKAHITGALFSDDSRAFLDCLKSLGFRMDVYEDRKEINIIGMGGIIPLDEAEVNVGDAGTAARFITAMLGLSSGKYAIKCGKQMQSRPMKELFDVLEGLGTEIKYLKKKGHLPVEIKGCSLLQDKNTKYDRKNRDEFPDVNIELDISRSTQYLSALLMIAPVMKGDVHIHITGEKKTGSYVKITLGMLKEFGINVSFDEENGIYSVIGRSKPIVGNYHVEPDISAACYFYAIAAITRGTVTVKNVHFTSNQGDLEFIEVLGVMGCEVKDLKEGIEVSGPLHLHGVDVDMNDFSDQVLTMAAMAPFVDSPIFIRNVGHIRGQESDRMAVVEEVMNAMGLRCETEDGDIFIYPVKDPEGVEVDTHNDHRVSMAFSIMGLKLDGVVIDNPLCCSKTFENYYDVFEELIESRYY